MTKRVILLIVLLMLLIGVMLIGGQALPVYAQGTTTPTPTVTPLPTDSPVQLHCNYVNPYGECTQSDDGRTLTIVYVLSTTWRRSADELGVNIGMTCLDGETCAITDTFPLFYDLSSTTKWNCLDYWEQQCNTGSAELWMDFNVEGTTVFTRTVSAGAGERGSGTLHETGIFTGATYVDGAFAVIQSQAGFVWWDEAQTSARYVISLDPIEDCDDNYVIGDLVGNYVVDATSETGNTHTLEQGQFYWIQVTGGAWIDNTSDPHSLTRDDIRISQDDSNWTILGDAPGVPISGCLSAGGISGGGYYFYADTGNLRVLVNDSQGDHGNNAGEVAYSLYDATPIEYFFGCTQYDIGDLVWQDAIPADDFFGAMVPPVHVPPGQTFLTPGELYAIEIIPPPYTRNGNQTYLAELATTDYPDLWYPLAQHPDVVCADTALDGRERVIFRAGELNYYMHAPEYSFNTGELSYKLYNVTGVPPEVGTCPQFMVSSIFYESSIPANSMIGEKVPDVQSPETTYVPGQYYAIEIVEPPWADGMPPELSFDAQMRASALPDDWVDFPDYTGFVCVAELGDGRLRGYFMAQANNLDYYMRANDHNTNFSDNNGALNYTVFNVSLVDDTPSACETLYELGDTIYNGYMLGTDDDADEIAGGTALTEGQWYYLGVTGGPLIDPEGSLYYTMTIAVYPTPVWYELDQWPEAACVGQTGPYTHIYFQAQAGQELFLRPLNAGSDIGGSISWILRLASPVSGCNNFVLGNESETGYVQSTVISGTTIPVMWNGLTVGSKYALDSVSGPWYDDDDESYGAQISENGNIWYPLETYPNALCIQALPDLLHTRVYFEAVQDHYYYRVNDSDDDFSNNQGTYGWRLYSTKWTPPPPDVTCDNNYTDTIHVADYVIPSNGTPGQNGVTIDKIRPGITYKIQSTGGPWGDFDVDSWALQISDDGGSNWYNWNDYTGTECLVTQTDHHQLLFITANDGIYKIRVSDPQGNFNDNTGDMGISLYTAIYDPDGGGGIPPPDWDGACASACVRPWNVTNVQLGPWTLGPWEFGPWMVAMPSLNVSNWLEYGRCSIQQYFAWCPHHTNKWNDIGEIFADREPFGTVNEASDAGNAIRMMMDHYNWNKEMIFSMPITQGVQMTDTQQLMGLGTTRLETISSHPVTGFAQNFNTGSNPSSPYNGGLIDLSRTHPGAYTVNCTTSIEDFIGPKLSQSVCFTMSTMNHLGVLAWFQLILNFCVLVLILFQIKGLLQLVTVV